MSTAVDRRATATLRAPRQPEFTLADRLRKIRHDVLRMRQTEFAESLGVTRSAYAAWEAGRTQPRDVVSIARQIEAEYGVAASWTLGSGPSGDPDPGESQEDDAASDDGIPQWTLGWRLQRALAHAGMRSDQMGQELGVTRTTISRWVNDHGAPPRAIYVRQWALRTGVPYSWLQKGEAYEMGATDGIRPAQGCTDSHIPDNSS